MAEFLYYYFGGTIAGIMGTLVSQPFDTYKIFLQNGKKINFASNSLKHRISFLYRGSMPCFIGYGVEKSLIFGTYSSVINFMNLNETNFYHTLLAGLFSGCIASLSITPAEQIKTDKQIGNKTQYNFTHLYKGFKYTVFRESIGFAIYFTIYNQLTKYINNNNEENFKLKLAKSGIIGALSAFFAWIPIYPIDVNKTLIQSGNNRKKLLNELHNLSIKNKIFRIYRGYSFCMMRAIPFHSTCFICFEIMKAYK